MSYEEREKLMMQQQQIQAAQEAEAPDQNEAFMGAANGEANELNIESFAQ